MNRDGCCQNTTFTRRVAGFFRWLLPGVVLALMPKCPACFAAYIALASGVGLSLPVAAVLRTGLILLCVGSLAFLTIRLIRRRLARPVLRP